MRHARTTSSNVAATPPHRPRRRTRRRIDRALSAFALCALAAATALLARAVSTDRTPFATVPTVVSVVDGDTVHVRIGREVETVRLIGIDTPETKDPRRPVGCFGPEASARTRELLPKGTVVEVVPDSELRDTYGRLLAYVTRVDDGLFVNLQLAAEGYAEVLSIAPNTAHAAEIRAAVDSARAAGLGLWSACTGH